MCIYRSITHLCRVVGVELTTFLWASKLTWLRLLWILEPLSPSLPSLGTLCIRNSPPSMKYTCVALIDWFPDTVQVCKTIAPPISTGWTTMHNCWDICWTAVTEVPRACTTYYASSTNFPWRYDQWMVPLLVFIFVQRNGFQLKHYDILSKNLSDT